MDETERPRVGAEKEPHLETYSHEVKRGDLTVVIRGTRLPPETRARLEVKDGAAAVCIEIVGKTGEQFDMQDLLPTGWQLIQQDVSRLFEEEMAYASHLTKAIFFPRIKFVPQLGTLTDEERLRTRADDSGLDEETYHEVLYKKRDFFKLRGAFLSLFHEVGHSHEPIPPYSELREEILMRNKMSRSSEEEGGPVWTNEKIVEYIDRVIKKERDAWAFALRTYRDLARSGMDVEAEMSREEVLSYVHDRLHAYETAASRSLRT